MIPFLQKNHNHNNIRLQLSEEEKIYTNACQAKQTQTDRRFISAVKPTHESTIRRDGSGWKNERLREMSVISMKSSQVLYFCSPYTTFYSSACKDTRVVKMKRFQWEDGGMRKKELTCSSSRLNSQYSLRVPLPLVRIPQPLIMMVPDSTDKPNKVQHQSSLNEMRSNISLYSLIIT